jgi:thiamine pyrophosphate-dependent acetolactate synthase large subunit-like protein
MAVDRTDWLRMVWHSAPAESLVLTTSVGAISQDWGYVTGEDPATAQLGHMGDVVAMAVGLAITNPQLPVICIDADGSLLLELGQLIVLGDEAPPNLTVFVGNNGCYESIGASRNEHLPTATARRTNLAGLANAAGVPYAASVATTDELRTTLDEVFASGRCAFIDVHIRTGPPRGPVRQRDGVEDKYRFVRHVEQVTGKTIIAVAEDVARPARA